MRRLGPLLLAAALAACKDELPTSVAEQLLPVGPVSVEVRLPWSQFASKASVYGGFGRAQELGQGVLANKYGGVLTASTLFHFDTLTTVLDVADSTGTTLTDDSIKITSGTLVLLFDRSQSSNLGPVFVNIGRTTTHWDARSATWQNAVDSIDVKHPWPEPGGGPVEPIGGAVWDPDLNGDSLLITIDAATVAGILDTTRTERGFRVSLETPGEEVTLKSMQIQLNGIPSVNLDSTVVFPRVSPLDATFIYDPPPSTPQDLRVGGVPSWRSVIQLAIPATVPGNPAICAITQCPLKLDAEHLNHASILLTSRATEPAFRPIDSLAVHAVSVLAPEVLPKSPLAGALFRDGSGLILGTPIAAAAFGTGAGRTVEVPITPLVEDILNGKTVVGTKPSSTIAILTYKCDVDTGACSEPEGIGFGSFAAPGQPGEPMLRLIVTVSDQVGLP